MTRPTLAEIEAKSAKNRAARSKPARGLPPDIGMAANRLLMEGVPKMGKFTARIAQVVGVKIPPTTLTTTLDAPIPSPKPQKTRQQSPRKPSKASEGEVILGLQLQDAGLTHYEPEYQFAAPRKWRADFAFLNARLLVEVEGGHWSNGRHNRGSGFEADIEKYNAATLEHWALLRFTTKQVKDGTAIKTITRYLEG